MSWCCTTFATRSGEGRCTGSLMTGGGRGLAASAAIATMAFLAKGGVAVPFTAAEAEAAEALAAAAS
jgi:hypothetical protein